VGKTYFCAALIPWIYDKIVDFRIWKDRDFLDRIRSSMNFEKNSYVEEIKNCSDHDFLIYDDLGSNGFTEWRKEVFFNLIDIRHESQKPTVFTSNLTRKQILDGLGDRCLDRLFDKENLIIELHDSPSLRQ
jgi:DNA replication protein DnaC